MRSKQANSDANGNVRSSVCVAQSAWPPTSVGQIMYGPSNSL